MSDLRMPDLNKVFLAGHLTRDPELRYTSRNVALCKMGLAASRKYKARDGTPREDTLFINVTVWDKLAEFCGENLKKGRPIVVEGRLTMNEWDDRDTGQKRKVIEVTATRVQQLDWAAPPGVPANNPMPEPRPVEEPVPEDGIPF